MNQKERERQEAVEQLRATIKPGQTIYTALKHVSRSGMLRVIAVYVIEDNEPRWISYLAAKATGQTFDRNREGVKMGGCGMDMGFALVYDLSSVLFPDGFTCIGKHEGSRGNTEYCPSSDHSNGDRDYTPHQHKNGGYALKHRWI